MAARALNNHYAPQFKHFPKPLAAKKGTGKPVPVLDFKTKLFDYLVWLGTVNVMD